MFDWILNAPQLGVGFAVMLIFNLIVTLIFGLSAGVSVVAALVLLLIMVLDGSQNVSLIKVIFFSAYYHICVVAGGLGCSCS